MEKGKIMKNFTKPFKRRKLWWLILYPISFAIISAVRKSSFIAEEIFAKRIFRWISQAVSAVTGILPFSLAELVVVMGMTALPVGFVAWLVIVFKRGRGKRLKGYINGVSNIFIAGGILLFMFVIGCGVNYYRYPVSYYLDLDVREYSVDELYGLCVELATRTSEARRELYDCENEEGIYTLDMSISELGDAARDAYKILAEKYDIFSGYYPAPKQVFFSKTLSKMEITGIFIPFTMEANVNTDVPDYSIGSTMCHELAHLHGFIREDEANYISYLVCTNSGNEALNYSGLMEALILAGNALFEQDMDKYIEVRALYDEGVVRDLYGNSIYWDEFEDTVISNTANKVNDTYLKVNNQSDGVKSYGRMVELLLAEYADKHEN